MKKKIAILYSTADGHTLKICTHISESLTCKGVDVDLIELNTFNKDILHYSTLIIGASIRYGKHHHHVSKFIETHKLTLCKIKTGFFSVNLVARKNEKNTYDTNPYILKFLDKHNWSPELIDVFAGKLDYSSYSFFDMVMIKFIMKLTNGPTKSNHPIEFTDWCRVDEFALKILQN